MSKKAKPTGTGRREFLKSAALMGSAATLAVVGGAEAAAPREGKRMAAAPDKPKGYHVTPHIRRYYETTRL